MKWQMKWQRPNPPSGLAQSPLVALGIPRESSLGFFWLLLASLGLFWPAASPQARQEQ